MTAEADAHRARREAQLASLELDARSNPLQLRWRLLSAIHYQQALARRDKAECHRLVAEHQRLATDDLLVLKSSSSEDV